MKILITGICGFVGSTLARELRRHREGIQIIGIDNLSRRGSEINLAILQAEGIDVRQGDVRLIADLIQFGAFDWLIDAAANPSILAGVDGKTRPMELLDHNLFGTIPMLEVCREWSASFTLLSTSRVYSIPALSALQLDVAKNAFTLKENQTVEGISKGGITEQFSTEPPISLYGTSKRCAELLALEYGSTFNFPIWINRCGVMAGAGQFGKADQGIFSFWIHSWVQRQPLKYIGFGGHGYQVRDCLHPRDLATLLWKQFDAGMGDKLPKTINVSGGLDSAISLAQLSSWCASADDPHDVNYDDTVRAFDLPWVVLDNALAKKIWDWKPQVQREDILLEILDYARSHPNWLALSC
jgi:CDP-paratose 2-epimerase